MDQTTTATLDPGIYDRNIAALRKTEPQLAEILDRLPPTDPPDPTLARTRDGRLSFLLRRPDGSQVWFGRTSIPGVRAEALLDRFDSGKANVILPGLGEGSEATLLSQRLGRHRAVFVWERDQRALQLALRLHDVAAAIENGRLVPIVCPDSELTSVLLDWLRHHPGHLCPNQMLMWPWQSMAELAPIRAAVEAAYGRIEQERQQSLAGVQKRLEAVANSRQNLAQSRRESDRPPVVALVALHAMDDTWSLIDALSAGASRLGWATVPVDIRVPGDVHSLARASRLAKADVGTPDLAILIDAVRQQVRDVLPASTPAISWLGAKSEHFEIAEHDAVAVTSPEVLDRATAAGLDPHRILLCPPPCLASPDETSVEQDAARPIDVLLVSDVGPIDPAALAPKLPSYAQLWKVACDLLAARIEAFTSDQTGSLLERAEDKLGVKIDEAATRQEMAGLLKTYLAPSMICRFLSQVLTEHDIRFTICGPGWASVFPQQAGPPVGTVRQRMTAFRQARLVIHTDSSGLMSGDALLAAGCGAAVVARRHPNDPRPGGLHTLLNPGREILVFRNGRELVAHIRLLFGDAKSRREMALHAVRRCLADHMPGPRLRALKAAATSAF